MSKRDQIVLKTKFKTVEQCKAECVDGIGIKKVAKTWSNKLYGVFDDTRHFMIASDAKGAALFFFEGSIIEKEDGIYMEGDIKVKPKSRRIVYLSIVVSIIAGILMYLSLNPVLIFMGTLFMVVPWFNYRFMKKSDVLYHLICKKVI